jgi:glycine/D-amino acid oxidase-like deaminating enzyme/nitrite reductase/ring-hydroxylating ferredoxin subunit
MNDYIDKFLPSINKDTNTPILIIGGGIAGLMCAYNFMKHNIKFILVDGNKLASGVSASTTAQISIAHDKIYDDISKKHGEEAAISYLKSQIEGLSLVRKIVKEEKIDCDYKEESTILGALENKNIKVLSDLYHMAKDLSNVELLPSKEDVIDYQEALEFKDQFIFNPMKYMMGIIDILIKNKAKLYENSLVTKINKEEDYYEVIINDKYKIKTNKIIMACHYPFLNPDNLYFAKIYQSKSYTIAFKTKIKLKANYVSLDPPYYYFRTYDKTTLIIGGSDHYTGSDKDIDEHYNILINKIYALDKNAKITYKWFTEDCMPIDSLPFVGEYSNKNPNIILVTGFQKWGFTNSHIAAKNITNMLLNKEHDDLYKTKRYTLIRDLKSTLRMVGHVIDGLVISKLFVKEYNLENIKIDSGKLINYKDNKVLVYRKSKDKYIFLENKCTHMGCSLIWNDVDKVWECKCHGSIFDSEGHVIYGPAIKDLKIINL